MAWTRQDLERQTLQILAQPGNTPAFELPTGTGGNPTVTASDQLALWFDEAVRIMAKSCYPVWGTGSYTNWAANRRQYLVSDTIGQLDSAVAPDTSTLWAAEQFTWSGSSIEGPYDRDRLAGIISGTGGSIRDTAAAPVAWGKDGSNLWVWKIPTIAAPAIGYGLMVPPRLAALSTTLDWISDRGAYILCFYGAAKAALARGDDDILAPRGPYWMEQFDKGRMELWEGLGESFRLRFYPLPPIVQQGESDT